MPHDTMRKALLALTFFVAAHAHAQPASEPFGLKMGMSVEDLAQAGDFSPDKQLPGWYFSNALVKGDPAFAVYAVTVFPLVGLCRVTAVTSAIPTTGGGAELVKTFYQLNDKLTKEYGAPTHAFDFLESGSDLQKPGDFMKGLLIRERHLRSTWYLLPNGLANIHLIASTTDARTGQVQASYEFENVDKCNAAEKQQRSKRE